MVAPVRPVNRTMVRGSGLRCAMRTYARNCAIQAPGGQLGVGAERDRAAQRPGRRDRAGAPQGAEPSERSERPALEGNE